MDKIMLAQNATSVYSPLIEDVFAEDRERFLEMACDCFGKSVADDKIIYKYYLLDEDYYLSGYKGRILTLFDCSRRRKLCLVKDYFLQHPYFYALTDAGFLKLDYISDKLFVSEKINMFNQWDIRIFKTCL